jgi:hypothetical protein
MFPLLAVLGLLISYIPIAAKSPIPIDCLYFACWVLFPATVGFLSWREYNRIIVAEPQTIAPAPESWEARATKEYGPLLNLPIPRNVRISAKGWLRIGFGVAVFLGIAFILSRQPTPDFPMSLLQRIREKAVPVVVLLAIGCWANLNLVRQFWSHVPLLKSGSVAIGRVVAQRYQNVTLGSDLIGRYSLVDFEFRDKQDLRVSGAGHDYTKSLFDEMPVLLFYDPQEPFRNVALGCSLFMVSKP